MAERYSMVTISVVIPMYNSENYIRETLGYIQNQTFSDIEIICVDDGSTDKTAAIVKEIQKSDHRIKYLFQSNLGAGVARNQGLGVATGEYISFLDADDIFDKQMLEKSYINAKKTDADIVIFRSNSIDVLNSQYAELKWALREELIGGKTTFSPKNVSKYVIQFSNGWAWDKLFRKKFIDDNKLQFQKIHYFNDSYFTYASLMSASKISILNEILATKRLNSSEKQLSLNRSRYWMDFFDVIESLDNYITDNNLEEFRQSFDNYCIHIALVMLDSTDIDTNYVLKLYIRNIYSKKISFYSDNSKYYYRSEEFERFKKIIDEPVQLPIQEDNCLITYQYDQINDDNSKYPDYLPILLSADKNYSRQMYVTLKSIIDNKKIDTKIIVYMTIPRSFSNTTVNYFRSLISESNNCIGRFVIMGNLFKDIKMSIAHITSPTYYRLVATNFINYDKCLYLDVDLIVLCDVKDLFDVKINNNYIAGVKAPVYICHPDGNKEHCTITGLPNIDQYVNAGVLLFNLKEIKNNHIDEKMIKIAHNQYPSQDQDVINISCYDHIFHLDPKYNVMTKYNLEDEKRYRQLIKVFGIRKTVDAYNNPQIIHYADRIKPWFDTKSLFSEKWWYYCSKTPFFYDFWNEMKNKENKSIKDKQINVKLTDKLKKYIRNIVKNIMSKI